MRFRLRLVLVSCTLIALAIGLFVSDGPTLARHAHPMAAPANPAPPVVEAAGASAGAAIELVDESNAAS